MSDHNKGIIAWFVNNPVASNLLVCMILVAGFFSVTLMKRDILPVAESRKIVISAVYPTASPKEVDEAITTKIEDALKNITEIRRIETNSSIGFSMITIEVEDKADIDLVLADVKTQVDTISTFPKELEKLSITKGKPIQFAMQVQISGKIDETQAKKLAEEIKRELLTQTIIKRVDILGTRPYEVSIEVSEEQLQKYRVTLGQVATKIRAESVNSPIGIVKSAEDYTLIRVEGQAYRQQDFENIVLLTTETGAVVRVKDVAVVKDAYIDFENKASFDGDYSVGLAISAVGDQDVIEVAEAAKAYVAEKKATLPDGVYLTSWLDATYYLKSRLNTMNSNLIYGALLVFLLLILFMELKMAFWVVAGIPVSIGGAFILMNMGFSNVTLNMVSMFGFIMVVGIVIDDSIVVAESVDDEIRKTGFNRESIIRGTKRVATPAIFGILTTIVAFTPMLFVTGSQHVYMYSVGFVVCACLLFSLMESKWVLPSHLMSVNSGVMRFFYSSHQDRLQKWVNQRLNQWIHKSYLPFVEKSVEKRYITLAIFASILIVTLGAVKGGIIRYELFPAEPNDFITASYSISRDASKEEVGIAKQQIQDSLHEMELDYQKEFATDTRLTTHLFTYGGDTGGLMLLELTKSENRLITSFEVAERWRKKAATIRNVNLNVSDSKSAGSRGLSYLLVGSDRAELEAAAESLLSELKNIEGLSSENHSIENQRLEYVLKLKPKASALGLTLADIGFQVKDGFYGAEAQRILRDREEVTVMVRYPRKSAASIVDLEAMHIRLPDGRFMPLKELAVVDVVWAESNIIRINGQQSAYVTASIDHSVSDSNKISTLISNEILPKVLRNHPGVKYRPDGTSYEEKETEHQLKYYSVIVLLLIYILLAIPLKSYTQPLIIMSAIPFGLVGAAWGHWLLDYPLSAMSLFGLIALCGIIVNDTLVLIDFINTSVDEEGLDYKTASIRGSGLRFRAILLTTATTFVGDLPMILETSFEARNMIPMAISLGVGIMFAIGIILILAPCLYVVLGDIQNVFGKKKADMPTSADN